MEEVKYKEIGEWLVALEVRDHDKHEIVAHAMPKRRIYGFLDHTESKYHYISCLDAETTKYQVLPAIWEALTKDPTTYKQLIEG